MVGGVQRDAVALLDGPGETVSPIASELGSGANIRISWDGAARVTPSAPASLSRKMGAREKSRAGCGGSRLALRRSGVVCASQPRTSRERRREASGDPTMPRGVAHSIKDMLVFEGYRPVARTCFQIVCLRSIVTRASGTTPKKLVTSYAFRTRRRRLPWSHTKKRLTKPSRLERHTWYPLCVLRLRVER